MAIAGETIPSQRGQAVVTGAPFDYEKLDDLLERAGIDVLIVSSKHNLRYMLGGYSFFFFEQADAIGVGRYVPLLVYQRGHVERTCYIGIGTERSEVANGALWAPELIVGWYGPGAMQAAVEHIKRLGMAGGRIGIETAFLGADSVGVLHAALPQAAVVDALLPLERFRAVKTPQELDNLREASEKVVDSMLTVFATHGPGSSTRDIAEALRQEETRRGLHFDYCLIAAGVSQNRAPADRFLWEEGDILSLDSGGSYRGYIGDLCRMGIQGEPDAELEDLLAQVDEIQQAARQPVKAGALGGSIYESVDGLLRRSPHAGVLEFVAHGMGLISHEVPRLTGTGPIPYPDHHSGEPLEAGMVLSIETTIAHARRGFIKLEDTLVVTPTAWEAFGDRGRGWNLGASTTRR
ncbi:Xaa-Pro peptidase family protein [Mesorhizobium sp. XAP10]|uniref:M24 family metallopeptidase n=1 Tax=unclassified Mesorhizobium TaxID=325217 RepID=UPI0023DEF38D|nr:MULTISPECIES: Xaa-Pro peptidase family protein [unclassified Mesorhizobium]MDF3154542.1 Xaa-Pro peptidase family protein [Mesorhizobium sp. XAP10]MDF3247908.1 Xaa-Pro peptidase family protein [Mesorhizobium sp. XAP4]